MQEEVENRAVTLVISATKLTGRLLKAAILKYLASRKEKRLQKARAAPEKPTVTASTSGRRRRPWHAWHGTSRMYDS